MHPPVQAVLICVVMGALFCTRKYNSIAKQLHSFLQGRRLRIVINMHLSVQAMLICVVMGALFCTHWAHGLEARAVTGNKRTERSLCDDSRCRSFERLRSRLESSKRWLFQRSDIYKGRRYYLSQQDPISRSEEAMATCALYGGYLVEIQDLDEFNFITAFIKKLSGFRLVLIGATDNAEEEVWRYRTTNELVPSFLIKSRKLGTTYNCLYLFNDPGWLAVDDSCYYTIPDYPTRFLCEIPEDEDDC